MVQIRRTAARLKRGDALRWTRSRLAGLGPAAPDGAVRTADGIARLVGTADVHALGRALLVEVLVALDGVPVLVAPASPRVPRRLMVREADAPEAAVRLEGLGAGVTVGRRGDRLAVRLLAAPAGVPLPVDEVLPVEVVVMRWRGGAHESSEMGAFRRVEAAAWDEIAAAMRGTEDAAAVPEPSMPVDAVYTWVDGSDPAWRARRDRALGTASGGGRLHASAADDSRYVDSDELRHSLRSLHRYAGWVRTVHIVTDGQVPAWLDVDHPRIRLVNHEEILGGSRFNSHAIEAGLHRIEGLAENYLYLNDDVFFGRPAHPGDYYAATGTARFFPSDLPIDPGPATVRDQPAMAAAKNGRDVMAERFGVHVATRMRHTVHPQLRGVARQVEEELPELVAATRGRLFRSPEDISTAASLNHWYGWALGRAVPARPDYLYLDISAPHAGQTLDALASLRRYDTFCLNQEAEGTRSPAARAELRRFLAHRFPHRAPWERAGH